MDFMFIFSLNDFVLECLHVGHFIDHDGPVEARLASYLGYLPNKALAACEESDVISRSSSSQLIDSIKRFMPHRLRKTSRTSKRPTSEKLAVSSKRTLVTCSRKLLES